jgi:hypothetical protein
MEKMEEDETRSIQFQPCLKKQKNSKQKDSLFNENVYSDVSNKKNKKRVAVETWNLSIDYLTFEKQLEILHQIHENKMKSFNHESKVLLREIERKVYGYKQQDLEKNIFDSVRFLSLHYLIEQMIQCSMKCFYCNCEMYLLYEIVRESKQWSVDRLDNEQGHNENNYVLACLECNLKRRRRTADKFLFTKQLQIVKMDNNTNFV